MHPAAPVIGTIDELHSTAHATLRWHTEHWFGERISDPPPTHTHTHQETLDQPSESCDEHVDRSCETPSRKHRKNCEVGQRHKCIIRLEGLRRVGCIQTSSGQTPCANGLCTIVRKRAALLSLRKQRSTRKVTRYAWLDSWQTCKGDTSRVFAITRLPKPGHNRPCKVVRDESDTLLVDEDQVAARWRRHWPSFLHGEEIMWSRLSPRRRVSCGSTHEARAGGARAQSVRCPKRPCSAERHKCNTLKRRIDRGMASWRQQECPYHALDPQHHEMHRRVGSGHQPWQGVGNVKSNARRVLATRAGAALDVQGVAPDWILSFRIKFVGLEVIFVS